MKTVLADCMNSSSSSQTLLTTHFHLFSTHITWKKKNRRPRPRWLRRDRRGRDCLQATTNNNKRSSPSGTRSLILKHAGDHHKPVLINWSDLNKFDRNPISERLYQPTPISTIESCCCWCDNLLMHCTYKYSDKKRHE